jgi:hypothetical protein
VSAFTLCYRGVPDHGEMRAMHAAVASRGGNIEWSVHPHFGRAYALINGEHSECFDAMRAECRAVVFQTPVIALAVFPSVPQALPSIVEALTGPGRPGGIIACDGLDKRQGVVIEWDLDRTPASVVLGLIDTELDRFHAGRLNILLSPLPLEWWTRIASDGLRAPEIAPDRVIENLLNVHRVAV